MQASNSIPNVQIAFSFQLNTKLQKLCMAVVVTIVN